MTNGLVGRLGGIVTISIVIVYMVEAFYLEKTLWQAATLGLVWHSYGAL
jgi:hypothetical protein